ncbi:MAG: gluconate 2-dehydrogenase subunit 3 family protein [Colwellia sp.]|nr:gluconate 2-dehydrogenase subunit 3 family protein [Colwellia sp.]
MSFFTEQANELVANISRRKLLSAGLKSAAGMAALTVLPANVLAVSASALAEEIHQDPWQTLNAVLNHLLPVSPSGPSAKDVQALNYLYNVVHLQPTPQDEIDFIYKGVGWLNSYSDSQLKQPFITLNSAEKETLLRGISQSRAGENWLSTLLDYLLEATLSPPAYGGNPNGAGWQWLEHQGGFPLPKVGQRYFELPPRAQTNNDIAIQEISTTENSRALANTPAIKRTNKA